jgi:hypothetical protein
MDASEGATISERDQLWAGLRALLPEIRRLAAGEIDHSERQEQIILLLVKIVAAELEFRSRDMT